MVYAVVSTVPMVTIVKQCLQIINDTPTVINCAPRVMPQFLTIIIYYCNVFIVQYIL
jgi:hypothetical protein